MPPDRGDPDFRNTGSHWGDESVEDPSWVHRSNSPHYPEPFTASVLEQHPIEDKDIRLEDGEILPLSPDQELEIEAIPTSQRQAFVVPVSEKGSERISTENISIINSVDIIKIVERFEKRKSVLILNRSDIASGTCLIGPQYGPSFPLISGAGITLHTQGAVYAVLPANGATANLALFQEFED